VEQPEEWRDTVEPSLQSAPWTLSSMGVSDLCQYRTVAEQGALAGTQERKEGLALMEEREGNSRGVQGSH